MSLRRGEPGQRRDRGRTATSPFSDGPIRARLEDMDLGLEQAAALGVRSFSLDSEGELARLRGAVPAGAEQYVVQAGDTLAQIADQLYDNPWAYPVLVFATNQAAADDDSLQAIADPNLIEPGWTLTDDGRFSGVGEHIAESLRHAGQPDGVGHGASSFVHTINDAHPSFFSSAR